MVNSGKILTILIPNYKTLILDQICLNAIKKNTDLSKIEIIVIDNESNDDSLSYLKSLEWIRVIERKRVQGESPSEMHARAMDLGLEQVRTEFFIAIHTDTIFRNNRWLDFLLSKINKSDKIAGVGSWKLEEVSNLKKVLKSIENFIKLRLIYPLEGKKEHNIEGKGKNFYYLRSHCALYKTDLVRKYTNGFDDDIAHTTAGELLHKKLIDAGYQMLFIPSYELIKYVKHFNHATMILHPELGGRKTATKKAYKKLVKDLNKLDISL